MGASVKHMDKSVKTPASAMKAVGNMAVNPLTSSTTDMPTTTKKMGAAKAVTTTMHTTKRVANSRIQGTAPLTTVMVSTTSMAKSMEPRLRTPLAGAINTNRGATTTVDS